MSLSSLTPTLPSHHLTPPRPFSGPPPMIKFAIEPNIQKMGYKQGQWFNF